MVRKIKEILEKYALFFKGKHEFSDQKGYQVLDLWKNQYQSQEKTLVNYKGKEIK